VAATCGVQLGTLFVLKLLKISVTAAVIYLFNKVKKKCANIIKYGKFFICHRCTIFILSLDCGRSWVWGPIEDYKIGIYCFSAKHAALGRKSKDWLAQNQDNMSKRGNMSIHRLLFHWASTIKIHLSLLVWYKVDLIVISLKINLFWSWYSWKIAELMLNNNHSLTLYFMWNILFFKKVKERSFLDKFYSQMLNVLKFVVIIFI
jgi:hypothetical protein